MGGGIGSILYSDRGTTREHFTYNAVGHTVALTLQSGAVAKTDLYEAFGGIVASTGQSANNRLANTKERSFTLSLDNHGFRYYDPEIGRYLTRDPIGYGDGLNVYLYVHNNPINHIDPLGLEAPPSLVSWLLTGNAYASPETVAAAKDLGDSGWHTGQVFSVEAAGQAMVGVISFFENVARLGYDFGRGGAHGDIEDNRFVQLMDQVDANGGGPEGFVKASVEGVRRQVEAIKEGDAVAFGEAAFAAATVAESAANIRLGTANVSVPTGVQVSQSGAIAVTTQTVTIPTVQGSSALLGASGGAGAVMMSAEGKESRAKKVSEKGHTQQATEAKEAQYKLRKQGKGEKMRSIKRSEQEEKAAWKRGEYEKD